MNDANEKLPAMATPRTQLIDSQTPLCYHLVSRCVRRGWLCGFDPLTGCHYDHRKAWLEERLLRLAGSFAIDLFGYAIMSNHFHLIVRYDPTASATWSHTEIVERWLDSCAAINPSTIDVVDRRVLIRARLLANPHQVEQLRDTLGSLSMFMKHLKQPIAWRANREDNCTGHFFEARFYSGALLDETAAIEALAYVDLNPVRAMIVKRAVDVSYTSLSKRLDVLANDETRLQAYLAPVVSGLNKNKTTKPTVLSITLVSYLDYLEQASLVDDIPIDKEAAWYRRISIFKRQQRAYGPIDKLSSWAAERGWSRIGAPRT